MVKRGKRRLGVGDDTECRLYDARDLGRVYVDTDQLEIGVDTPAHLRLVQAGTDPPHQNRPPPPPRAPPRRMGRAMWGSAAAPSPRLVVPPRAPGICRSGPKPRPMRSEGIWPLMHRTGALVA